MNLSKLIRIGVLAVPAIEIACFLAIAALIGAGKAVLLLVGLSACGALLLKRAGSGQLVVLRRRFGERPGADVGLDGRGLVSIAAAILLLVPGFVTAALGLALFVTPVRWLRRTLAALRRSWLERTRPPGAPTVIDLERDQWHVDAPHDRAVPHDRSLTS